MNIRPERGWIRKHMRAFRHGSATTPRLGVDMSAWIRESLEDAKNSIVVRTEYQQLDEDMKPFRPLSPRTLARKRRTTPFPGVILRETGAMLNAFTLRVGKRSGTLKHTIPKKPGLKGSRRFDYGKAHQKPKQERLPQRKWWMTPGSAAWKAWEKRIGKRLKYYLVEGGYL